MNKIKSLTSFQNLADLESEEEILADDCCLQKGLTFSSMLDLIDTFDGNDWHQLESRSKKKPTNGQESSFQLTFMKEHVSTLVCSLSNIMECFPQFIIHPLPTVPYDKIISLNQLQILLKNIIPETQSDLFFMDLKKEQRFCEFLRLICGMTSSIFSNDILRLAHTIWLNYLQIQNQYNQDSQLINFGEQLLDSLEKENPLQKNQILILHQGDAQGEEKKEEIKEFMRYFIITSLFIIEQFYVNPFYEKQQDQSLLFEDQDQTVSTGRKIMKIQ